MDTIRLVLGSCKFLALVILVGFSWSIAQPVLAVYRVHLDEATVAAGYMVSLPNGKFNLGLSPGTVSEPTTVKIQRVSGEDKKSLKQQLTEDWTVVGHIRTYNIQLDEPRILHPTIWLSLQIPARPEHDYFVAYYDRESQTWKEVPSEVNWFERTITTSLPFPYATVSVFSEIQDTPVEKIDFQSVEDSVGLLDAASAIVMDKETGQVLFSKNKDEVRSIASLTKVPTTWLALQYAENWSQETTYQDEWDREGGALRVVDGETLSVEDLLYSTLIGSANNTAVGLAHMFTDQTSFLSEMNRLADHLGLEATQFVEPSGLDPANVSTAYEYAVLSKAAFEDFSMLQIATTPTYSFTTPVTGDHHIKTTNQLLYSDLYLTGGKTGYIDEAGYCLMIQAKNETGHEVIVVVLGEPTSAERFSEAYDLASWAFENYSWD